MVRENVSCVFISCKFIIQFLYLVPKRLGIFYLVLKRLGKNGDKKGLNV